MADRHRCGLEDCDYRHQFGLHIPQLLQTLEAKVSIGGIMEFCCESFVFLHKVSILDNVTPSNAYKVKAFLA